MTNTQPANIREAVRERYASAAREASRGDYDAARRIDAGAGPCGVGCGPTVAEEDVFGVALYGEEARDVPRAAVEASLGCGIPTAVADLREGETVLDLGSGAGADVLISARRVGAPGRAIGLDMTDEMLELARANARDARARQCRVRQGLHRGHPARRRQRRRGHLQLRNQSRRR